MADNNEYGWGLSRNLPILIILLIILGFLVANVITFNDIAVAPEDPNQTITKSRASYLYWFNLIILLFVLTIIILLVMFMWRNKNTPNVDYFGKNITIIDAATGKNIKKDRDLYKSKKSLEEIAAASVTDIPYNRIDVITEKSISNNIVSTQQQPNSPFAKIKQNKYCQDNGILDENCDFVFDKFTNKQPPCQNSSSALDCNNTFLNEYKSCKENNIPNKDCLLVTEKYIQKDSPCQNTTTKAECYNAINQQLESLNQ